MSALLLVMVGTDHHPFDALVDWADRWATTHPGDRVVVQHGYSTAPRVAVGQAFYPAEELRDLAARATVVVCHGGPGTVADARAGGTTPVVVARDPERGEHVDDHQQRFVRWAAAKGVVRAAADVADLDSLVGEVVERGPVASVAGATQGSKPASDRLADTLARTSRRRLPVTSDAPPVVFIAGSGRSGSTLLERLVGGIEGVVPLGEVVHLWQRGIAEDQRCACGEPFSLCPFWTAIGDRAFGGWAQVDVDRVLALQAAVDRHRHILRSARRHTSPSFRDAVLEYTGYYREVYRAALDTTGGRLVVDSSKHASTVLALSHDRQIDVRTVQIVRDARGVAYSWTKEVERPEAAAGTLMPRYPPLKSTALWLSENLLLDGLRHRRLPLAVVRYENLVSRPAAEVQRVWRELDLPGEGRLDVTADNEVVLGPSHSVAGNPMRFRSGPTRLVRDEEWRRRMDPRQRRLVTALCFPVLFRYGYTRGSRDEEGS